MQMMVISHEALKMHHGEQQQPQTTEYGTPQYYHQGEGKNTHQQSVAKNS